MNIKYSQQETNVCRVRTTAVKLHEPQCGTTHTHTLTHNKVSFTDIWSSFKLREISTTAASCVRPPTPPCWLPTSYKVPQYSDLYKSVHVLLNIWIYTEGPPTVVTANKNPDIDVHSRPQPSTSVLWPASELEHKPALETWGYNVSVHERPCQWEQSTGSTKDFSFFLSSSQLRSETTTLGNIRKVTAPSSSSSQNIQRGWSGGSPTSTRQSWCKDVNSHVFTLWAWAEGRGQRSFWPLAGHQYFQYYIDSTTVTHACFCCSGSDPKAGNYI